MGRRKWITKKDAAHFTLVHRPQNDPRIHDESAPAMVLNPTPLPNGGGVSSSDADSVRSRQLSVLASQLGDEVTHMRANEGEAANYGVYFDDTKYDYMQHLRELGTGSGEAIFVDASQKDRKSQQKGSLAVALAAMDLQDRSQQLLDADILPSTSLQRVTYQNQQDVPDAIAGFQPDMDPRLREALEALEDDAYVDNSAEDDDDLFQKLAKEGRELDARTFEEMYSYDDGDDEGWESDATEKPTRPANNNDGGKPSVEAWADVSGDDVPELVSTSQGAGNNGSAPSPPEGTEPSDDWMSEFRQFKKDQAGGGRSKKVTPALSEVQSSVWTTTTDGGRKKKRKGALTQQSGFSMTSSSLVRTEQLTLLDARFDKIDEEYNEDMDDMQSVSAFSSASSVQGPLRKDFDNIMDDFLGGYSMQGKRTVKKGRAQSGLEQLDDIRRGLGPARLAGRRQ